MRVRTGTANVIQFLQGLLVQILLTKGAYLQDGERAINLYAVFNAASKWHEFWSTEGLELFSTISGSPVRGLYVATNDDTKLYVVAGDKVYRVLTDGTATQYTTTLDTNQGMVEFSDNGTQITITDGASGYVITIATALPNGLAKIADANFPGGGSNCQIYGYTIVAKPDDEQVNSSDLNDSTAWNALNFASAEGIPDNLRRVVEFSQKIYMFGIISTEIWYYDGGTGFPFERWEGAVLNFGLAAKQSLAKNDQAMYFLARTRASEGERVIVEVRGTQAQIVSSQGINELLATLTNTANAEGFAYMREGHSFYELTFPSDDITIVYDAKEGMWHERRSRDANDNEIRHRARCYAYFNGFHMVGDFETGKVYKLKSDVYTEDGETIIRKLYPPEISDPADDSKFVITRLKVPMKVGVGLVSGQGEDPLLMFRYSKDGGRTWSNEKTASFGKMGEYDKQVVFLMLGQMRRFSAELVVSDPVPVRFEGPLIARTA